MKGIFSKREGAVLQQPPLKRYVMTKANLRWFENIGLWAAAVLFNCVLQ